MPTVEGKFFIKVENVKLSDLDIELDDLLDYLTSTFHVVHILDGIDEDKLREYCEEHKFSWVKKEE